MFKSTPVTVIVGGWEAKSCCTRACWVQFQSLARNASWGGPMNIGPVYTNFGGAQCGEQRGPDLKHSATDFIINDVIFS